MKQKLKGFLKLCRPLNTLMFWVSVWIGAWLQGGGLIFENHLWIQVLWAAFSATAIGAGSNAINDYYDIEIGRINRPNRPLPSGILSLNEAWWAWAVLSGLGIGLGVFLSFLHVLVAVLCVGLLYAYSRWLKKTPFLGNVMVSSIGSLGVLYGAWVVGSGDLVVWAMLFAFWATLARELVKDIQDIRGDQAEGAKTLPIILGEAPTRLLAGGCIGITILITPLPYLWAMYSGTYLVLVCAANAVFLLAAYTLGAEGEQQITRTSSLLKGGMMLGMLALVTQPL